jgi:selenocysteine lyase/cysteine desulfurase
MRAGLQEWQAGASRPTAYDRAVAAARSDYARIVGTPADQVAVGSQASVFAGLVASGLPDGSEVVTVEGDFASVVFPFLVHADRGVDVRQVPLERLAEEVRPSTAMVAFSLVQSADGRLADVTAVRAAAAAAGATTLCDVTQAAGWFPLRADDFDVTVCSAYKWLCAPRGAAFLTVRPAAAARLRPVHAGWYAGESVWESVYGPQMHLAADARRFDVSPAWLAWVGAAAGLALIAAADLETVRRHDLALADAFRAGVGLAPAPSPVVALPDAGGRLRAALEAAGCVVAGRAGKVRLSFHVWNDEADVDRAVEALRGLPADGGGPARGSGDDQRVR